MKNLIIDKCRAVPFITAAFIMLSANAQQSPEYIQVHGSACQPANLTQAINFQTSWSQRGVSNINALGSGRSFFVVCPIVVTDDNTVLTLPSDIFVETFYSDNDGTNVISCAARRYKNGVVIKQSNGQDPALSAGFTGSAGFNTNEITDPADSPFDPEANNDYHVLVCAMPPQSTIEGYTYDFD